MFAQIKRTNKPVRPSLAQFGLTQKIYDKHASDDIPGWVFCVGLLTAFVVFWSVFLNWGIEQPSWAMGASMLIAFVAGAVVAGIVYWNFYPKEDAKRVQDYKGALESFERARRQYEENIERPLKEYWFNMSGRQFEVNMRDLFVQKGYETHLTQSTNDKGVDIYLRKGGKITIVQCKAHKKPVGPSVVRELYGSMVSAGADEAILAALGGVTTGGMQFARGKPIKIVDINTIIEMVSSA